MDNLIGFEREIELCKSNVRILTKGNMHGNGFMRILKIMGLSHETYLLRC